MIVLLLSMTDTTKIKMAISEIVMTFVSSLVVVFILSFLISPIPLLGIALIIASTFIVTDMLFIFGCEGDSIIFTLLGG